MDCTCSPCNVASGGGAGRSSAKPLEMNFCRDCENWRWVAKGTAPEVTVPSVKYCFYGGGGMKGMTGEKDAPNSCRYKSYLSEPWPPRDMRRNIEPEMEGEESFEKSEVSAQSQPPLKYDDCYYCGKRENGDNQSGFPGSGEGPGMDYCLPCKSWRTSDGGKEKSNGAMLNPTYAETEAARNSRSTAVYSLVSGTPKAASRSQPAQLPPCLSYEYPEELIEMRKRYSSLQDAWDAKQMELARVQGEMFEMRNQLQKQSIYCANLGSVLATLVWRMSRHRPAVHLLLTNTKKIKDFLSLVNGTVTSYMDTYGISSLGRTRLGEYWEEFHFVMSMAGIVANLAAVGEGRFFLASDPAGQQLIQLLINLLPSVIPDTPQSKAILRILLTLLFNVTLNTEGLGLVQAQKPLLVTLGRLVSGQKSEELQAITFMLLESITSNIQSQTTLNLIENNISLTRVQYLMMTSEDTEIVDGAKRILENIEKAERNQMAQTTPSKDDEWNVVVGGKVVGCCREILGRLKQEEEAQKKYNEQKKTWYVLKDPPAELQLPKFL